MAILIKGMEMPKDTCDIRITVDQEGCWWARRIDVEDEWHEVSKDFSEYCDKLWNIAYDRGKKEASPIRCDECKYWDIEWIPAAGEGHYCPMMDHVMVGDEWCCYGERRTDG